MTEHKHNHVTMNFTMIMSQFAWPFLEVAITNQSYKASLILAYSDARGASLLYTLLPGELDSYRDRINSLFLQNGMYLGLSAVQHISQSSGIYSTIPANIPDDFNLLFLGSP